MLSHFTWRWEIADVMGGITQLVESLTRAEASGGFDAASIVLKTTGRNVRESTTHGIRIVLVTTPCPKYDFDVGVISVVDGKSTVSIIGLERYAGFTFSCALPPVTFSSDLEPDAVFGVSWRAKNCLKRSKKIRRALGAEMSCESARRRERSNSLAYLLDTSFTSSAIDTEKEGYQYRLRSCLLVNYAAPLLEEILPYDLE